MIQWFPSHLLESVLLHLHHYYPDQSHHQGLLHLHHHLSLHLSPPATTPIAGTCKKVTISKDDTIMLDGAGGKEAIEERVRAQRGEALNAQRCRARPSTGREPKKSLSARRSARLSGSTPRRAERPAEKRGASVEKRKPQY